MSVQTCPLTSLSSRSKDINAKNHRQAASLGRQSAQGYRRPAVHQVRAGRLRLARRERADAEPRVPGGRHRRTCRAMRVAGRRGNELRAESLGMAAQRPTAPAEGDAAVLGHLGRHGCGPDADVALRLQLRQAPRHAKARSRDRGRGGLPRRQLRDVHDEVLDLPLRALRRSARAASWRSRVSRCRGNRSRSPLANRGDDAEHRGERRAPVIPPASGDALATTCRR
jgi:hypothetical protein